MQMNHIVIVLVDESKIRQFAIHVQTEKNVFYQSTNTSDDHSEVGLVFWVGGFALDPEN